MRKRIVIFVIAAMLGFNIYVYGDAEDDGATTSYGEVISQGSVSSAALSGNEIEFTIADSEEICFNETISGSNESISTDNLEVDWLEEDQNRDFSGIENETVTENEVYQDDFDEDGESGSNKLVIDETVSDNDMGDTISENTSEMHSKAEQEAIYRVEIPTSTQIYIDPENLREKGQIFSEKYKIKNYSNRDIMIVIKNIDVSYEFSENSYELLKDTVNEKYFEKEKMRINMVWDNEDQNIQKSLKVIDKDNADEYVIYLEAAKYNEDNEFVKFNNGSKGTFYFTGSLNSSVQWEEKGLSINFRYEVVDAKNVLTKNEFSEIAEDMTISEEERNVNQEAIIK